MDNEDKRCVNVPSWSLPIEMINCVSVSAEALGISQSQIVREALEEKLRAMKEESDAIQCDK